MSSESSILPSSQSNQNHYPLPVEKSLFQKVANTFIGIVTIGSALSAGLMAFAAKITFIAAFVSLCIGNPPLAGILFFASVGLTLGTLATVIFYSALSSRNW